MSIRKRGSGKAKKSGKTKSPTQDTQGRANETLERMKRYIRVRGEAHLGDPNTTSIGIGYKTTDGVETQSLSLVFSVGRKLVVGQLQALGSREIPAHVEFEGMQIPTDVIERSFAPSYVKVVQAIKPDRKRRLDPLIAGISIANISSTAGTLGLIVEDTTSGQPVALSNWHVLAGAKAKVGDQIVQPGPWGSTPFSRTVWKGMKTADPA